MQPVHGVPVETANRCRLCLLPLSLKGVRFDDQNTCEYCQEAQHDPEPQDCQNPFPEQLHQKIEHIRRLGAGRPYDAVVGLSGGRDSSYLAYLLVRKHKLRCLAAYYRTPFGPDLVENNVNAVVQALGIPLVRIENRQATHINAARYFFRKWHSDPNPYYAALTCAPCKFVNRDLFRIARRHGARSVVCGGNPFEMIPFLPSYRDPRKKPLLGNLFGEQVSVALDIFGKGLRIAGRIRPSLLPLSAKAALLYLHPHSAYLRLRYPRIEPLQYFHHAPWRESECVGTIQNKLGWQAPPGAPETWKADCDFANVKNYMFFKTMGMTYIDALYSNLVRAGQMTRNEGLGRIRLAAGLSMEGLERSMKILGLPTSLIDRQAVAAASSL